uniref:CHAT domain-containing protein n=1 Tax=Candidatus Kentrum sp. LPFa TaxID=2126335 RepID=A0A450WXZ8_9GAMM|nr:MAG: CHAT domain-containing protein [Candidatus Kentron sp. LPFa]VFK35055.1 MAG: CHAT domain-containing protein [Candidatus Kentron sp. LPFa]
MNFKTGNRDEPCWLALLIPAGAKDESAIILKSLGPAGLVDEAFARLRATESKEDAQALYALLFGELDGELAKYDILYLAPDGMLDLVAFARLVLPDGRYWIERQQLRQIRAGRDLVGWSERCEPQHEIPASTVGVRSLPPNGPGGPRGYRLRRVPDGWGSRLERSIPATPTNTLPPAASEMLPAMNQHLREARDAFSPLPATGPEVGIIAERYEELTNHEAVVCTGTDASDHRLKHLSEPPRVLHLATHGFFLENGLALAGANRGIMGETGTDGEDGILYALEAQNLNLEGTELVVLSACDTGKGKVDYSEGVYGLTRALRTAGARNILMTLWPLNDELAEEFMLNFYENWLSEPSTGSSLRSTAGDSLRSTLATALYATRLAWINSKDKEKRNPRYWAPYVLVE